MLGLLFAAFVARRWNGPWARISLFRVPDLLGALGVALCASGVAFAIWARRTLGANWSAEPSIRVGHELVRNGPYHWARHPIYSGILMAFIGTFMGTGRVRTAALLGFVVVVVILKIRIEESLMMRQFPGEYPAYRKSTKALVPFLF
jgi:protein-S-isoprenylcysteine O-methyltransferase Ste14